MKIAKSYKISDLVVAFVMAVIAAFSMMGISTVKAATASQPLDYVSSTDTDKTVDFAFEDGKLTANLVKDAGFVFDNELVVDCFEIKFNVPAEISKFSVEFTYDSFYVNGNKNKDGKFDKEITYSVVIDNAAATDYSVKVDGVEDNYLKVMVNGADKTDKTDAYYKMRVVDKPVAKIGFTALEVSATDGAKLAVSSVSQNYSDEKFMQTFEVDADGKLTDVDVLPRVTVNDSFFVGNSNKGYSIVKQAVKDYTLTLTPYTVLGNVKATDVYLAIDENNEDIWLQSNTEKPKKIAFGSDCITNSALAKFYVVSDKANDADVKLEVYDDITVNNGDGAIAVVDDKAPVWNATADARDAFVAALEKAIKSSDGEHFIHLGSTLDVPSMEDMVYDDQSSYADLDVTLYYKTDSSASSASSLKFNLSIAGDYLFYVVFADEQGNKQDVKEIYDTTKESEQTAIIDANRVFTFYVADDAPIKVNGFEGEGVGYRGITYTAPSFKIDASGCTTTYALYYNANKEATIPTDGVSDSDGWVEIPKASSVTDTKYNKNGYTYNQIKSIGYDGSLSFTPDKVGTYLIKCTATSETTSRSDTGYAIVSITQEPAVVKVPSNWLQNNVWSVVFLSIGTLCLIGIVVLLCIKPKEETDED